MTTKSAIEYQLVLRQPMKHEIDHHNVVVMVRDFVKFHRSGMLMYETSRK